MEGFFGVEGRAVETGGDEGSDDDDDNDEGVEGMLDLLPIDLGDCDYDWGYCVVSIDLGQSV